MTKMLLYLVVLLCLGGAFYYAFVDKNAAELEKGTIGRMTDEAAQVMVDRIRVPIEKARDLKKREEKRIREMQEALKEQ